MNTFEEIQKLRGELNRLEKLAKEAEIKKVEAQKNCTHDFEVFPCGCKKCKKCGILVRANIVINWNISRPAPRFFL